MKLFLKVLLILLVAALALKLLPWAFGLGVAIAAALAGAVFMGFSLVAGCACVLLVVGAVLSPIWLPVLAIIGAVALVKRMRTN